MSRKPDRVARLLAGIKELDPSTLQRAGISVHTIQSLVHNLPRMTPAERGEVFVRLEKLVLEDQRSRAANDFMAFVRAVWPGFIEGHHLRKMAVAFMDIALGRKKRLIINMPPRHGKSEFTSYLFPAWYIGKFPDRKLMIATHTAELAKGFGRRIRNLMATDIYQSIFPGVTLAEDSKAQGKWNTNLGGEFYAAGVGSAIAGRGADLLIIDDPYSEQDARDGDYNPEVWEKVWTWYQQGPRQRLQPGAAIALVHTRWGKQDMTERLLEQQKKRKVAEWTVIRFPALLPSGRQLWPEFWKLEEIEALQDELDPAHWAAQYQQDPTSDIAAIIKRTAWREWRGELPDAKFIVTTVDTAHGTDRENDFSAWTTWAVFETDIDGESQDCALMTEATRDRLDYADLKQAMLNHYRDARPDLMIIETKAAGAPLVTELRQMGLPVRGFTPTSATGNKVRRLRQVSDVFAAGRVFHPDRTWAREVIEELASFPKGQHDDFVDTISMALSFMKEGNFIRTDAPLSEDVEEEVEQAAMEYY